eukprot:gnl/TRDRNA2_/TRDRNA2_172563_c0_seq1.p1 gnl/TRDRNA2_/TRDRNA2_172563_c0~~gnl/TRDRNA2_/TRDRNA2_172563_c0_seq1.p1  ORF type:complete len:348 (-),score=58.26 gnl/TRDRNA2_/TRDRNA2_172563_c0_seq1:486-1529(-)
MDPRLAERLLEEAFPRRLLPGPRAFVLVLSLVGLGTTVLWGHEVSRQGLRQHVRAQESAVTLARQNMRPVGAWPSNARHLAGVGKYVQPASAAQSTRFWQFMHPATPQPVMDAWRGSVATHAMSKQLISRAMSKRGIGRDKEYTEALEDALEEAEAAADARTAAGAKDAAWKAAAEFQAASKAAAEVEDKAWTEASLAAAGLDVELSRGDAFRSLMKVLLSSRSPIQEKNDEFRRYRDLRKIDDSAYTQVLKEILCFIDSVKDNRFCKMRLPFPLPSVRTKLGSLRRLMDMITTGSSDPVQRQRALNLILDELCRSNGGIRALEKHAIDMQNQGKETAMAEMLKSAS